VSLFLDQILSALAVSVGRQEGHLTPDIHIGFLDIRPKVDLRVMKLLKQILNLKTREMLTFRQHEVKYAMLGACRQPTRRRNCCI